MSGWTGRHDPKRGVWTSPPTRPSVPGRNRRHRADADPVGSSQFFQGSCGTPGREGLGGGPSPARVTSNDRSPRPGPQSTVRDPWGDPGRVGGSSTRGPGRAPTPSRDADAADSGSDVPRPWGPGRSKGPGRHPACPAALPPTPTPCDPGERTSGPPSTPIKKGERRRLKGRLNLFIRRLRLQLLCPRATRRVFAESRRRRGGPDRAPAPRGSSRLSP